MPDLFIDEALHENIPPLDPDDYAALKAAIEREGCITDPVLVWNDGTKLVIVNGVHRFKISKELGIECPYKIIGEGLSRDEIQSIAESRASDQRNMPYAAKIQLRKITTARRAKEIAKDIGGANAPRVKVSPVKPKSGGDATTTDPTAAKPSRSNDIERSPKSRQVADELGMPRATVVRAVEFHDLVEQLCSPARRAIESGAVVASAEELQALGKLSDEEQIVVIRKVRVGQAKSISDVVKVPKKKSKKTVKLDPHAYWNQIDAKFGEVIRLIDKAANALNLPNDGTRSIIMDSINEAMEYTQEFLGIPTGD